MDLDVVRKISVKTGFQIVRILGNYDETIYNPKDSPYMVIEMKKNPETSYSGI